MLDQCRHIDLHHHNCTIQCKYFHALTTVRDQNSHLKLAAFINTLTTSAISTSEVATLKKRLMFMQPLHALSLIMYQCQLHPPRATHSRTWIMKLGMTPAHRMLIKRHDGRIASAFQSSCHQKNLTMESRVLVGQRLPRHSLTLLTYKLSRCIHSYVALKRHGRGCAALRVVARTCA